MSIDETLPEELEEGFQVEEPAVEVLSSDDINRLDAFEASATLLQRLNAEVSRSSGTDLINADPLTAYLSQLRHVAPLESDQQQELAARFKEQGDKDAAKLLVLTNLRLVVKIAREYQRRWTNLLDLIQEGNVGLSEAVTRYDPYRGVKFTSYAQYWIRAMILNYLMNHLHPVKIGSSRAGRKLFYNLKKARRDLIRQGHQPTPALIAEYLEVDESEVVRVAAQLDAPPVFIDAQAPGHEKTTVGDLMPTSSQDPESAVAELELQTQIMTAVKDFGELLENEREQAIWFKRMIAEDNKSLVELGEEFGVSKERIRQVEVQIRERFRRYLLSNFGEEIKLDFLESQ